VKYACLMPVLFLMPACTPLMMECSQPGPIPQELRATLDPLRTATDSSDIMAAHLYNMERCGVCYSKYEALREATKEK
jgi:hypothetical protein